MSALRRRELLELADAHVGDKGSAASLALALEGLEAKGWTVSAVVDDMDEIHAGELSDLAARDVAKIVRAEHVQPLIDRAPVEGGWAIVAADGALVLLLTGRRKRIRHDALGRIRRLHGRGVSLTAIARQLEEDRVPAPRGGLKWDHRQVANMLKRASRR